MACTPLELARLAASAADEKKAQDIVVIDLTHASDVCDYFVICTAGNKPQADAILEAVEDKIQKNCQESPLSVEGRAVPAGRLWTSVLSWCMSSAPRRVVYRLERLWVMPSPEMEQVVHEAAVMSIRISLIAKFCADGNLLRQQGFSIAG
jgi:ribosome-associated protein